MNFVPAGYILSQAKKRKQEKRKILNPKLDLVPPVYIKAMPKKEKKKQSKS